MGVNQGGTVPAPRPGDRFLHSAIRGRKVGAVHLLAEEARKMGANAVINAKGGRRVTAFSWSAGYVSGTAVKVDDIQLLKSVPGTYH